MKRITKSLICLLLILLILIPYISLNKTYAASSKSAPCSTIEEIHNAFPETYWSALEQLNAKYPKWKFVAFTTGLTWEQLFTESAEAYPSRNLAYGYVGGKLYFPTSWYATDIKGSYNWAANDWTRYDNGSWLQASKEAIAYCMDPRNFLDEIQVFQFMDTASALNTDDSIQAIKAILKSDYYKQSGEQADLYDTIDEEGNKHYLDFAQALTQIGQELNLNQVTLASRLYQENANGNSPLITGTKPFTTKDGQYMEGGYYNYFNIGASGNSTATIVESGLQTAYQNGWDTKYKSLLGGAEEIMKSFVKRGQTTIYSQKFSVDSSSSRLFWGQYMQNITAPQTESQNVYKAIQAADALNSDLTFIIPIFSNMPDSVPYPEKDGNPNNKLGSIYINGSAIDNFNTDITQYQYSTNNDSAKLNILAYAKTTTVSYIDPVTKETVSDSGKLVSTVNLNYGDNPITVTCTAQNGDIRTYVLNITSTHQNTDTPGIPDDNNDVNNGNENQEPEDTETVPSEPPKDNTDNTTKPTDYVDITQDGEWDIFDAAIIYAYILDTQKLSTWQAELCDVNKDGSVDIFDASLVYQHILGHTVLSVR